MKTKIFGLQLPRIIFILVAASMLALLIPICAQAEIEKDVQGESNANHPWVIQVDNEGFQPSAFGSWHFQSFTDGTLYEDETYDTSSISSTSILTEFDYLPDGATIGIDPVDYRLHFHSEDRLGFVWDTYVEAIPKDLVQYETYSWYVDLADGTSISLDDLVDASATTGLVVGQGVLADVETLNFYAEFIGCVGFSATASEGHNVFSCDYYIQDHTTPASHADYATIDSYLWELSVVGIDKNGVMEVTFNPDDGYNYFQCEHVTPVAKEGYTFKSWTIDGVEYPVGTEATVSTVSFGQNPVSVVANYKANTSAAQTGDDNAIAFIVIGLIVCAGALGIFASRKFFKK